MRVLSAGSLSAKVIKLKNSSFVKHTAPFPTWERVLYALRLNVSTVESNARTVKIEVLMFKKSKKSSALSNAEALNTVIHDAPHDGLAEPDPALAPPLRLSVISALEDSSADWRKVSSLASDLKVSPLMVTRVLEQLERDGLVRRPVRASGEELTFFRLSSLPLLRGEVLRKLKAAFVGDL